MNIFLYRQDYLRVTSIPLDLGAYKCLQPSSSSFTCTPEQEQAIANARAFEAKRHSAFRNFNLALHAVDDLEIKLGITERWTAMNEKYQHALTKLNHQCFIKAVDTLEGLVVQRLFELSKANLSGTGLYILTT
jgi:hypothetical protein